MDENTGQGYDVVVVGGGAAGLSGAVALARSRRSVLVVDAGQPRNAPAEGVHNLLGQEGVAPGELLARGRAEVRGYGGEIVDDTVTAVEPGDGSFVVRLASGAAVAARRVLLATGLTDRLPDVAGLAERWGRDVLHCPYCHGWEVRDRAVGVLVRSGPGLHQVFLFRQLTERLTVFLDDAYAPSEEEWEQLAALGIEVVDGAVERVEVTDDRLTAVVLRSGVRVPCEALAVAPRFEANADLAAAIGLETVDSPMGPAVSGDPFGGTAVPGVFVAGNVADVGAQVVASAAAGLKAGAMLNADLVQEDLRRAVAARRVASATV